MSTEQMTYQDIADALDIRVETLRGYKYAGTMPDPDGYFGSGRGARPWWYRDTIVAWRDDVEVST